MTARDRIAAGGGPWSGRAHAPADGGSRRNLRMAFENISAPASASPSGPDLQSGRATLKFGDLLQAVIDVGAVVFIALFLTFTAIAVVIALFILFFVRVH